MPFGPEVVLPRHVLANAETLSKFAGTFDKEQVRRSFLRALELIQLFKPNLSPQSNRCMLVFEIMNVAEEEALRRIMAVEKLPINWQYDKEAKVLVKTRIDEAWELIRHASPRMHLSIHTIIGSLLMARLRGYEGGSVSSVIGAIWVGLDPERPAEYFAEHIVHEYVHNCLFLDDMVNCIFIDGEQRLGEVDALVQSSILGILRGYDKSYHSAFVAVTLAELNRRLNRPDRHDFLLSRVPKTLCGLLAKQQFLTPHGQAMLADLNAWVEARIGSCGNR